MCTKNSLHNARDNKRRKDRPWHKRRTKLLENNCELWEAKALPTKCFVDVKPEPPLVRYLFPDSGHPARVSLDNSTRDVWLTIGLEPTTDRSLKFIVVFRYCEWH
jgi:hypothetical protein